MSQEEIRQQMKQMEDDIKSLRKDVDNVIDMAEELIEKYDLKLQ